MPPRVGYKKMRPKSRYTKKPKAVSESVKKYVNRTIHKNIEDQTKSIVYLNNAIGVAGYAQSLIPNLSQGGSDVEKRRGNSINLRGGYIKGYVNLLPYDAFTNPQSTVHVRMMLVSMKKENSSTFDSTNLFQFGNTSLDIQGNIGDMLYQINKDVYTVYEQKTFTLGATSLTNSVSTVSPNIMSNFQSSIPFYFNWGKHFKLLKYNDGTSVCTNRNLHLVVLAAYADGSGSAITPCEIHLLNQFNWEDA